MTSNELKNCSENLQYLINCVSPSFNKSNFIPGQTFQGLKISLSTLKNALSGISISPKTLRMIANSFSLYLLNSENQRISEENLFLAPDKFKTLFPINHFKQIEYSNSPASLELFTNKLYRCYYMISNSPYNAYMAYFKLFEIDKKLSAYMVRGIQDFAHVTDIHNNFDNPFKLLQCFKDKESSFNDNKKTESIHLYIADDTNITTTEDCIKIDFSSLEEEPCHSTMFWNISIANKIKPKSYIGGSALVVDTNDGRRGKDICSFKMGLEAIEKTTNSVISNIGPLNNTSLQLISELSLQPKHGVTVLDNSDDSRWYRFLQESINREKSLDTYDINDLRDSVLSFLLELKHDYSIEVDRLKSYIEEHIEIRTTG